MKMVSLNIHVSTNMVSNTLKQHTNAHTYRLTGSPIRLHNIKTDGNKSESKTIVKQMYVSKCNCYLCLIGVAQ